MIHRIAIGFLAFAGTIAVSTATVPAAATQMTVSPGEDLAAVLGRAAPGDTVTLAAGIHNGPVRIARSLVLTGEAGAVLRGSGKGSVIEVMAEDVTIRGLVIQGSGKDVPEMDSGVLARRTARGLRVEDNRLEGNLFGVYLHGAPDSRVLRNRIIGMTGLRISESGNGVSLWNAPGSVVAGNEMSGVRDGIFVNNSRRNRFLDNSFRDLRFAIHYMYTHDSEIAGNRSTGNDVGYAIMFSDNLSIRDNASIGDRDHGLLMNYANRSLVTGNLVRGGKGKCLFIYNAHRNQITGNRFEDCAIGIHFTAGSEGNAVSSNAFIGNRTQVKYVGTRLVEWSADGRGNFWSDNPAFDLNGDGIADRPYRPNGLMDDILWRHPPAKLLLNSPAVDLLRLVQSRFPALYPGGVLDSAPLMAPPPVGESPQ